MIRLSNVRRTGETRETPEARGDGRTPDSGLVAGSIDDARSTIPWPEGVAMRTVRQKSRHGSFSLQNLALNNNFGLSANLLIDWLIDCRSIDR